MGHRRILKRRPINTPSPLVGEGWGEGKSRQGRHLGRRPFNPIQHDALELRRLKTPSVVSQQQDEDVALAVLARPAQGVGSAWHMRGVAIRTPGPGAILGGAGDEDVVAVLDCQVHVQLVVGGEVRYALDSGVVAVAHVDRELAVGWVVAGARDPAAAGDFVILRPRGGHASGDVDAHEPLAATDVIPQAVHFRRRQRPVAKVRHVLSPRVEHQNVVPAP